MANTPSSGQQDAAAAELFALAEQRHRQLHDTASHLYLAVPHPSEELIQQAYAPAEAMAALVRDLRATSH